MTCVRVDAEALARWSGTLDSLPPLGPRLPACPGAAPGGGVPGAVDLERANADGLRALAEVVRSFDTLMSELCAAATTAATDYRAVDWWAASRMERDDRG
jgi:hypothetical protein